MKIMEYLDEDDFESEERFLEVQDEGGLTEAEYEDGRDRFLQRRLDDYNLDYRIYTSQISDSSGRSVVVAIRENPLFELVDVTVHASVKEAMSHFEKIGKVCPPDWKPDS